MVLRVGGVREQDDSQDIRVLRGPAPQITSRLIRSRAIRRRHLGPDVQEDIDAGGVTDGNEDDGRFWHVGTLLVCTHRLTGFASGTETWTFPRAFNVAPRVTATALSGVAARTVTIGTVTSTTAELFAWDAGGSASNPDVDVMAIGVDLE